MSGTTSHLRGPEPDPRSTADARSIVDKVRKLLAMAEGSSNPHEADAFSRKAAELIAAHRIDPARLRAAVHDELAVRTVLLGRGAYVRARLALLQGIAEAHGCRVVFAPDRAGTTAYVAGFQSDLDTTELLYASLHAQAAARMAGVRRPTGASTQQWRRSFLFGFADQVRTMLGESQRQAEQAERTGTALPMLRARDQRVDEYARQAFGRVVTARRPAGAQPAGWHAGRRAAERADLGRRPVAAQLALGRGG
jgi:hypothetical protein